MQVVHTFAKTEGYVKQDDRMCCDIDENGGFLMQHLID